jgi:tetratricopeptide (TPR) repeat protein/transglutaminase-like putative cysteine protease
LLLVGTHLLAFPMKRFSFLAQFLMCFISIATCAQNPQSSTTTIPAQKAPQETAAGPSASSADDKYAKEGFIVDQFITRAEFQADGTGSREMTAAVRMQGDSGVQAFAVLSFPYTSDNENVDVDYVRVRKQDGTIVGTPTYNIQDIPAEVTRVAPMYSDVHEKHVTVKALGVGDVLEYRVRYRTTKPEVPGHFWFEHNFTTGAIVKDELLEIVVPRAKYIKVSSPGHEPQIKEDGDRRTYTWKTNNLERHDNDSDPNTEAPKASVSLTTFHTWDEVGKWYAGLQRPQLAVTPAIKAKAAELTKGLNSDDDRIRALYNFVSTHFHYISLSFGIGRYQPHAADDVLGNEYGDCKDKHTLLAALLKAEGYDAWPALINSSREIDPEVPSPRQFDHVITVVARGSHELWLDTTPEVAPFGLLLPNLRDHQALVVPDTKPAVLEKTPADPPFPAIQTYKAEGKLSADGTYTGHARLTMRSDGEVQLRSVFRAVPPAKWKDLVQQVSYSLGFAGDVSDVAVSAPEDTTKPFEISYDYTRKSYSDWDNHRITPPLPPTDVIPTNEKEKKPRKPVLFGDPGESVYTAKVELPPGFKATVPVAKLDLVEKYGEYHAAYRLEGSILTATRRVVIKNSRVAPEAWDNYVAFRKAVNEDEIKFTELNSGEGAATVASSGSNATHVFQEAYNALQRNDLTTAREGFRHVLQIDPGFEGAHGNLGIIALRQNDRDTGISELSREEELHPNNTFACKALAMLYSFLRRNDDAIAQWKKLVAIEPTNRDAILALSGTLITEKKYSDAVSVLENGLKTSADSSTIKLALGIAYLRSGEKDKGATLLQDALKDERIHSRLNSASYELAESNTALDQALQYAQEAVQQAESLAANSGPDEEGLRNTQILPTYWDTLGWVYFRRGEYDKAVAYIRAAWRLSQDPVVGDHLGQVYQHMDENLTLRTCTSWPLPQLSSHAPAVFHGGTSLRITSN